jgi:hypothetical protein
MHTPFILSEADGSRSEPSAKSKDPLPARTSTDSARSFRLDLLRFNSVRCPLSTEL